MIYFTGGGALYAAFCAENFPCQRVSIRMEGISTLLDKLEDNDTVIHNSANVSPSDFLQAVENNFSLTQNLVEAIHSSKKKIRLIFLSSMSILDEHGNYKGIETMNAYSFSKYLAEIYCLKHPYAVTCVRFSTIFYQDPLKDGLSKMIQEASESKKISLINGGVAKRDFIPIDLAARYLYKMTKIESPLEVYNLCSGMPLSFSAIASIVQGILPGIIVTNRNIQDSSPTVISDFNTNDLIELGQEEVNIEGSIKKMLDKFSVR